MTEYVIECEDYIQILQSNTMLWFSLLHHAAMDILALHLFIIGDFSLTLLTLLISTFC